MNLFKLFLAASMVGLAGLAGCTIEGDLNLLKVQRTPAAAGVDEDDDAEFTIQVPYGEAAGEG